MTNEIKYFPTANWAMVNGAFTPEDLREIADKIENTTLQDTPIKSEERSQKVLEATVEDARLRQEARQSKD